MKFAILVSHVFELYTQHVRDTGHMRLLVIIVLTAVGFFPVGASAATINPATDLEYIGSFRVPATDDFGYSGLGMTFSPVGNGGNGSLFLSQGNVEGAERSKVSEISIPALVKSKNPSLLNTATQLQAFAPISTIGTDPLLTRFGDVAYLPKQGAQATDKLYWVAYRFYNTENADYDSIGWSELNLSNSQTKGAWDYAGANLDGRYIFGADGAWADLHVGGKYLLTGFCRGGANGSSRGPDLYAVAPWQSGNPPANGTLLSSSTLLLYETDPGTFPDTTFPGYTPCDRWNDGAFLSIGDKRAVLFVGFQGSAGWSYQGGGWVCSPYTPKFLWYDADQLAAVAAGTLPANTPVPYSTWTPLSDTWETTSNEASETFGYGGVGYDPVSQKLYVIEIAVDVVGFNPLPVVHVFQLQGGTPDTTPPTSPTNMAATASSSSNISVSWIASTDNIGVAGYQVERCLGLACSNFAQVGTPSIPSFVDTGLTASTGYSYRVRAIDAAGNLSGWSNVVGATTQAASAGRTINVHNLSELYAAFASEQADDTIIIHPDGSPYTLNTTALAIDQPNVTVRGSTGNFADVVIRGDAMSAAAVIKIIFLIDANAADNVTIKDLSVGRVGWHAIKFSGENNAGDGSTIENVRLFDTYEQLMKASDAGGTATDNVTIKNSLFEYSAGVGPQYYIGGIDAHRATGWVIQGNTFRDIQSPSGSVAEHAIHLWDDTTGTGGNTVERNTIINCDRGIGLWRANGDTIRNNMLFHDGSGAFADVAIDIQDSPGVKVYNNTSWIAASGYYTNIELRGGMSTGLVLTNNLVNKGIGNISAPSPTLTTNLTNAQAAWFVNVASNLHLASGATAANNAGTVVAGLTDDFDGQVRPQGGGIDVGADEYEVGDTTPPAAPTGLGVN